MPIDPASCVRDGFLDERIKLNLRTFPGSGHADSPAPTRPMKKLTNVPNLTELTYRSVKQQLLDGTLREGMRLTEELLATQLGISKSPVREALNRLEVEGLICIESRRGAHVREFSPKEIGDLYDFREVLEVHSVAIAKLTPGLLRELAGSIERMRLHLAAGDRPRHVEEDLRFHGKLAEASGNAEFCRVFENIQQKSLVCRYKSFDFTGNGAPTEHGLIYEALRMEDRVRAQTLMQHHIRSAKGCLLGMLEVERMALA
jgi:DNA-binding GntR family transcriptional regulator